MNKGLILVVAEVELLLDRREWCIGPGDSSFGGCGISADPM